MVRQGDCIVKELFVPALGMAMEECLFIEWLVQPGDEVRKGDPVAIIETDKATMELEAPVDGRLGSHLVSAGMTVPVGTTVSHILEDDETAEMPVEAASTTAPAVLPPVVAEPTDARRSADPPDTSDSSSSRSGGGSGRPYRLSPRGRRLQAESLAEQSSRAAVSPASPDRHRAAVAEAVSESWRTIPHFGVTSQVWAEVLLSSVTTARTREPRLTATDLILRAFAHALFEEGASGNGGVGLAVATERGVSIPVIADAGTLSLSDLVEARHDAVTRARAGRMAAVDGSAPAFTLSNLGTNDVEHFTGVIPLQQSGLLTVGRAKQRPVVAEGMLAAVVTMFATLNIDHRVYDGAHAGAILDAFSRILNDSNRLIRR